MWFATRGFPAISRDGQRVALAVHQDLAGRASANLRVSVRKVDGDAEVDSVTILAPAELDEPQAPSAEARALLRARIERANAKLADLLPMPEQDRCSSPLPWPTAYDGASEGCYASVPPAQTVVCGARKGASAPHVLTLTMRPPLLSAFVDGERSPTFVRDVGSWSYGWDGGETADNSGKLTIFTPPHLASIAVDFEARVLVVQTAYCNIADSHPKYPDEWHVFRLPKLPRL